MEARPLLLAVTTLLFSGVLRAQISTPPTSNEGLYLSPAATHGGKWCFNPNSPKLRILTAPPAHPNDPVDAAALAADLKDLREFLRTQYPGYGELAQAPGFDVDDFFRRWRESLAGRKQVPFGEAIVQPLQKLRDVVIDQHLQTSFPEVELKRGTLLDTHEFQVLFDGVSPDVSKCSVIGAQRVYEATLRASQQISQSSKKNLITVSAVANGPVRLKCADREFTLNERPATPMPKEPDQTFYTWSSVGDTAVIRIKRLFGTTKDLENLAHIPRDYPQHSKFKRIIFDLRGNGGGDDSYVYYWISEAKNGTWSSGAETKLIGDLWPCDDWNIAIYRLVKDGTIGTAPALAELAKIKAKWPERLPDLREQFNDGLINDKSEHPYQGRIYALIDRRSASSGESSAFVLRQALGAVILGERSAGYLTFGNQRPIILPRSGVRIMVPTKRNWFDTPMETVGVPVDFYLENTATPISELLPILDKMESTNTKK
jgi:peptidase S41-like protein